MSNNIEQIINEIEDYIDTCKFSPLSTTKIMVNKDELEELLEELKLKTPGEIKKYQRMLANKNSILEDAKQRAENIIAEATEQASAMVNDHEIMQQAYIQGNEIVAKASEEAQKILNNANAEADSIRMGAIEYTDSLLEGIQNTITYSMENITMRYEAYMKSLQKTLEMVIANRNELNVPSTPIANPQNIQKVQEAAEEETFSEEDAEFEDYTVEMDDLEE
ncbi:MAG: ATPase [Lachnospiraceae bacterium]|nr:ATPase [Lachnospiraceae bacterium]